MSSSRSSHLGGRYRNLIPLNEVPGSQFTRSDESDMDEFVRRLNATGIATTLRDTRRQRHRRRLRAARRL